MEESHHSVDQEEMLIEQGSLPEAHVDGLWNINFTLFDPPLCHHIMFKLVILVCHRSHLGCCGLDLEKLVAVLGIHDKLLLHRVLDVVEEECLEVEYDRK